MQRWRWCSDGDESMVHGRVSTKKPQNPNKPKTVPSQFTHTTAKLKAQNHSSPHVPLPPSFQFTQFHALSQFPIHTHHTPPQCPLRCPTPGTLADVHRAASITVFDPRLQYLTHSVRTPRGLDVPGHRGDMDRPVPAPPRPALIAVATHGQHQSQVLRSDRRCHSNRGEIGGRPIQSYREAAPEDEQCPFASASVRKRYIVWPKCLLNTVTTPFN